MSYNTFKNSLDSEAVNLNDRFNRAQWKFSPPDLDEEIAKDIHMGMQNKVNNALYQLRGWNTRDINYLRATSKLDPICCMFEEMKAQQMPTCPILCSNPDVHFSDKKCYPIYKVYQVLKKIDENAAKHLLKEEFRKIILNAINDEERLLKQVAITTERTYSVYSLPDNFVKNKTVKKKIVLVIDFLESEMFNHEDETTFYTGLNNLLENIDQNFTCMLSPALKMKEDERWMKFLSEQIKNCQLLLVLFSPRMIENLTNMRPVSLNEESTAPLSVENCVPLNFLWTNIMQSHKPLAGVVFDEALVKSVSSLIPVVFYLPKNMKLMLGYLFHRLQNL